MAVGAFFEGSARLALSHAPFFDRVAGHDDASWRHRWLRRRSAARAIYYGHDAFHPTRGWTLRPSVTGAVIPPGKPLNSNARGLRGRADHPFAKPAGRQRILVFGDSFTFGEDVGDDEAWPARLQQLLPGVDVLNFGVHGYAHDQMLLYLQDEGTRYAADLVILGFVYDDLERNLLGFRDYAKPRYAFDSGRLTLLGPPLPTPDETLAREPWRSKFSDLLTMLQARRAARRGDAGERMQALGAALLDEFRATVERMGARPAFAYLPVHGEIVKADMAMTRREQFFFRWCRERAVQSMYLRPYFLRHVRAGTPLKSDGHWGPFEHQVAAEGIAAYVREKRLLRDLAEGGGQGHP